MEEKPSRRGKITEENREEARRLFVIWDRTYEDRKKTGMHSQGAFGAEYKIGNQAAVGFFLHAKTALSLKAARGFATGLGCNISDFSERLAKLEATWPFELVDRDAYEALTTAQKAQAQVRMMDEITLLGSKLRANGTNK